MFLFKVISGGQTGADMGGLLAAKDLGLETGGVAPRGYRTEYGPNTDLCDIFGLSESTSSNYRIRTRENILLSDGTIVFSTRTSSPGTTLTIQIAESTGKPFLLNPSTGQIREWIIANQIKTLNVAGNRESVSPGITERVRTHLKLAIGITPCNTL